MTFLQILYHVHHHFGSKLRDFNQQWINLQQFANIIQAAGSPIPNCWGFIDGTARAMCRPTANQEMCYSGHKRFHCIKFQVITVIHQYIRRET